MTSGDYLPDAAPPAETPPEAEPPVHAHGCVVDLILRFFYFAFHTIALTVVGAALFAGAGYGAFYLVQRQFRGEEVTLPNLAGYRIEKAAAVLRALKNADLGILVSDEEFSETVSEGEIISQKPPSDSRVKAGTVVRVKVSKGTTRIAVPDVCGKDYPQARVDLHNAFLADGETSFISDPNLKKDYVIAQDPPPKSLQFRGTPVNLLVSLGSESRRILMPSLIDMTVVEARERLAGLGLAAPTVTEEPHPGKEENLIFAQDPAPGATVAPDAPIKVTIVSNLGRLPTPGRTTAPVRTPAPPPVPTQPAVPTPAPTPDMPPAVP